MNSSHLDAFVEAIEFDNPVQVKEALQKGLGQEDGFSYDNGRVWSALLRIKSLEVLNVIAGNGFTLEDVKGMGQLSGNPVVLSLVNEAETIIEKDKLNRCITNTDDKKLQQIKKI